MTQREILLEQIRQEYRMEAIHAFAKYPEYEVFRHGDNGKWFGVLVPLSPKTVGLSGEGYVDILNVKLDPMLIDQLRTQKGFLPAYHMNKISWISICLDGSVELDTILDLVNQSFRLTASKKTIKELGRTEPKNWLIPANPRLYDVISAFKKETVIGWKQSSDVHVGDILYMYVAAPCSSIMFKCKALEVDLPRILPDGRVEPKRRMIIELLDKYEQGVWSFERMKQFGVYAVRGPRSMPKELIREIERKV